MQSEHWRKFQENWGRKTFTLEEKDQDGDTTIFANMIVHKLPIVGRYFYVPRGPVVKIPNSKFQIPNHKTQNFLRRLVELARENNIGWIRIEPASEEVLNLVKENVPSEFKIVKSSADVQAREILMVDLSGSEEEMLMRMKPKTRYNIRLARKKGVNVFSASRNSKLEIRNVDCIDEFIRLAGITAKRDKVTPHPKGYYRKMLEIIPSNVLKLYVAEYEGKIISANLVSFFGDTVTYLHGASDNIHRNVMAPYLLQWQAMIDAKKAGCARYDLGGVKIRIKNQESRIKDGWEGITRFKVGFAPDTKTIVFPGSYDIILSPLKYKLYRFLQKIKKVL